MKDIGKNIKQRRIDRNLTQDELAEKLFVTRQTVSNYEIGKSRPDVDMLTRIAEVLETDVNALIYGPAPDTKKAEQIRLITGAALTFVAGAALAFVLEWGMYNALIQRIAEVDALNLFNFVPFETLLIPMIAVFAAAGMFVGIVGSWTSIRKFMDV